MKKLFYPWFFLLLSSIFVQAVDSEPIIDNETSFERARKKLEMMVSVNDEYVKSKRFSDFEPHLTSQSPTTTIIMCSDSRVQPSALHGDPKGHLFTIRNIGNQIESNKGSADYGVRILKTPLLLILGHTDCGAVKAVMKGYSNLDQSIKNELNTIDIGNAKTEKEALINNISTQIQHAVERYKDLIDKKDLFIVGGIYDIQNIFGFGHGALVFTNINGISISSEIRIHPLFEGISKIKIIN